MNRTSHSLIELVHALENGAAFYEQAIGNSRDPQVADLFHRMHHVKSSIAAALTAEIAWENDGPHRDGTWVGALRHAYSDIAARMSAQPDGDCLPAIEAQEDRLLDAFRLAAASDPNGRVRDLARTYLPDVQRLHAELHHLQQSRAA